MADRDREHHPLIYLVDDEPVILDLLARCLEKEGYRTESFADPVVAYAAFAAAEGKPDLLITDYTMPGMD
ncbi:MAG: response regulator, partial [Verrucomicrobia bacterium]|nr:response regulator [Verrucomicrobiota bacterium]